MLGLLDLQRRTIEAQRAGAGLGAEELHRFVGVDVALAHLGFAVIRGVELGVCRRLAALFRVACVSWLFWFLCHCPLRARRAS